MLRINRATIGAFAVAYFLTLNVLAKDAILCVPPPMPDNSGDVNGLIGCINKANALGGGTIELGDRTYTLPAGPIMMDGANGLPDITSNITIKNGTITKDPTLTFRHFHISPPGSLSLERITLENGNDQSGNGGGSIFVAGNGILGRLEDCRFLNNFSMNNGGAINATVAVAGVGSTINTITRSTFAANSGQSGGAIALGAGSQIKKIEDSTFSANTSTDSGNGGAVFIFGASTIGLIRNSKFYSNQTNVNGGAIDIFGNSLIDKIESCTFSQNQATSCVGGAILSSNGNSNRINVISNCTFDNNHSGSDGGAIGWFSGTLGALVNNTYNQNLSGSAGGAIVINSGATIGQIFNNTFAGNRSQAMNGGAGIYNCGTIGDMVSNIGADNLDTNTTPGTEDDVNNLNNAPDVCGPGMGTITTASFNLIGINTNTGTAFDNGVNGNIGNKVGTTTPINPELGVLKDNGGPTETMALLPNSPAIGAGANPLGLHHDQRGEGFRRMVHGQTDIGAFEVQRPPECPCPPGRHCPPDDCHPRHP